MELLFLLKKLAGNPVNKSGRKDGQVKLREVRRQNRMIMVG